VFLCMIVFLYHFYWCLGTAEGVGGWNRGWGKERGWGGGYFLIVDSYFSQECGALLSPGQSRALCYKNRGELRRIGPVVIVPSEGLMMVSVNFCKATATAVCRAFALMG
jgi:hypothetical protein